MSSYLLKDDCIVILYYDYKTIMNTAIFLNELSVTLVQ